MPRLFVGLDFPPEIKLTLSRMCVGVSSVRWVEPGNFHLTLRFIGEVEDSTVANIAAALRDIQMPRFWLTLAGVRQFGGHTLWVGVEPNPALLLLQNAVEDALEGIGPAADERPYLPHVKLARSRRRRSFRSFLAEHAGFRADPFGITAFSLIESRRSERGSIYEHREDYPLLAGDESVPIRTGSPTPSVSTGQDCAGARGPASACTPR